MDRDVELQPEVSENANGHDVEVSAEIPFEKTRTYHVGCRNLANNRLVGLTTQFYYTAILCTKL